MVNSKVNPFKKQLQKTLQYYLCGRFASLERSLTIMKQFEGDIHTYNKHLSSKDFSYLIFYGS